VIDVIIVGAGTAGLGALREVRKRTQNFVIINDGPWGTMCARVGCMPSKTLIEAANAFHRRLVFSELGIAGGEGLRLDGRAVLERVRKVRDGFVSETRELTEGLGERAISGRASLRGPHEVAVNGRVLEARRIVIATGSRPVVPQAWKPFADRLLTTDSLFEQTELPARLAVVGLGPVGLEMAQALARLGVQVTAFHAEPTLGGLSDGVVNDEAIDGLRRELDLHLGREAQLTGQEQGDGQGLRVTAGPASVVVDRVLVAMGRAPNIEGLGLERLDLPLDERGRPKVDRATLQLGGLPIFLIGDVNGEVQLQHEAGDDGHIAGLNALAPSTRRFERRTRLSIVFSDPNLAVVGQRFAALDVGRVLVGEARFTDQGRARMMLRNVGVLRIYAEREGGALLGAELFAPEGEHLAHWLAVAIHRRSTVLELLRAPFYHPTVEEGLRTALLEIARQLPNGDGYQLVSTPGP
jgi:dihydrolipoamide dehydrogenase